MAGGGDSATGSSARGSTSRTGRDSLRKSLNSRGGRSSHSPENPAQPELPGEAELALANVSLGRSFTVASRRVGGSLRGRRGSAGSSSVNTKSVTGAELEQAMEMEYDVLNEAEESYPCPVESARLGGGGGEGYSSVPTSGALKQTAYSQPGSGSRAPQIRSSPQHDLDLGSLGIPTSASGGNRSLEAFNEGGDEGGEDTDEEGHGAYRGLDVWHEVTIQPYIDPATGDLDILITQSDATGRAETEAALSRLNEVRLDLKG